MLLNDDQEATPNWYWTQTHWDNYDLIDPNGEKHSFRDYLSMCWWCGTRGINATQS